MPLSRKKNPKKSSRTPNRSTSMRKADEAFSLFIRTRDSQPYEGRAFKCISCHRVLPIEQADCGHYVNRSMEGNIQDYRKGLIEKIGLQQVELIESMKHLTNKISTFELELLAKHYKQEIKKFDYQIKF